MEMAQVSLFYKHCGTAAIHVATISHEFAQLSACSFPQGLG